MLTRTAMFEGSFGADGGERFFSLIEERLAPLWHQFPHAQNVRWFRLEEPDDATRPIVLMMQIDYPSREAMAEALASPVRDQARAVTMELMQHIDGRFYHFVSEGGPR